MRATRLYASPAFLEHQAGPHHPESPSRLSAIDAVLRRAPLANVETVAPREATRDELLLVHTAAYVDRLQSLRGQQVQLDADTAMSPHSHLAALLAAGAAAQAVAEVLDGTTENAFALVRPPGHHAEGDRAMGFCLFNNAAIAASVAVARGVERVLLLDWDVHHGNGSQHTFWRRRDVLYASVHQHPFYPGTGAPELVGAGAGQGYNVNVGLPEGQGDADYAAVFEELLLPVAQRFDPGLVVVSAGFDAHRSDPLGGMRVTERCFAAMAAAMKKVSRGKLVLLLEGGYDLGALGQSVHACVEVLAGGRDETFARGEVSPATAAAIAETSAALGHQGRAP